MLIEAASLLITCFGYYLVSQFFTATATGVLALILAVIAAIVSHRVGQCFSTDYSRSAVHYLMCVLVAGLTWFMVQGMFALRYLEPAAEFSIQLWRKQLSRDQAWRSRVFAQAYEDVKRAGGEDFTGFPHPAAGGRLIPTNRVESIEALARRYTFEAAGHWRDSRPLLSRLLWTYQAPSRSAIAADASSFLARSGGRPYPLDRAIDLAARGLAETLRRYVPRLVLWGRILFVGLILLVQAVPVGIIAWKAQREVRPVFT